MHYVFVDIGCGHTNVSVDQYGLDVLGLLVDPIQEFCNVLPTSNSVKTECAAITDYDGLLEMNISNTDMTTVKYFPIDIVADEKYSSRVLEKHTIYGSESAIIKNDWLSTKRTVKCMKLESVLLKYNIDEVDQLKIDVEGYENIILNQVIDLMRTHKLRINKKIIFEYNHLSDKKELDKLSKIIEVEFGFTSEFKKLGWNEDIIMTKIAD